LATLPPAGGALPSPIRDRDNHGPQSAGCKPFLHHVTSQLGQKREQAGVNKATTCAPANALRVCQSICVKEGTGLACVQLDQSTEAGPGWCRPRVLRPILYRPLPACTRTSLPWGTKGKNEGNTSSVHSPLAASTYHGWLHTPPAGLLRQASLQECSWNAVPLHWAQRAACWKPLSENGLLGRLQKTGLPGINQLPAPPPHPNPAFTLTSISDPMEAEWRCLRKHHCKING
jgi:hypothetical protein